jgi:hypothetical protein
MYKKVLFSLMLISILTIPLWAEMTLTPETSPWEHTGSELTTSVTIVPGSSPITYSSSTIFDRELEQFGYVPRFMPGIVSFDKNNRPYIFSAIHSTNEFSGNQSGFESGFHVQSAYIQTIDPNLEEWIAYDVEQIIRDLFSMTQYTDPDFLAGHNYKTALSFDDDNNYFFSLYESSRAGCTLIT